MAGTSTEKFALESNASDSDGNPYIAFNGRSALCPSPLISANTAHFCDESHEVEPTKENGRVSPAVSTYIIRL